MFIIVLLGRVPYAQPLRSALAMQRPGSQSNTACAALTGTGQVGQQQVCLGQALCGAAGAVACTCNNPCLVSLVGKWQPPVFAESVPRISFGTTGACRDAPAPRGAGAGAAVIGMAHDVQADTVGGQDSEAGSGEQLAAKVQECESLRTKLRAAVKKGKAIEQQRDQLRQQVEALQAPQVGHTQSAACISSMLCEW